MAQVTEPMVVAGVPGPTQPLSLAVLTKAIKPDIPFWCPKVLERCGWTGGLQRALGPWGMWGWGGGNVVLKANHLECWRGVEQRGLCYCPREKKQQDHSVCSYVEWDQQRPAPTINETRVCLGKQQEALTKPWLLLIFPLSLCALLASNDPHHRTHQRRFPHT